MTDLKHKLAARLPDKQHIWPVFSVIVFIIFTWMLYNFFFQIPSWLFYMKAVDILILLAYVMSYSLIESLLVMSSVLLVCMVLPSKYFKDKFVTQGAILVVVISGIAYFLRLQMETISKLEIENQITTWLIIVTTILFGIALMVIILAKVFDRLPGLSRGISSLANRMVVFSYIYVPLGLIGLIVVIIRNIF